MINLISYFIPFFIFLGFTIGLISILKTKFSITLPISFFLSTIIMFVSQIFFRTFKVGLIVILIFSFFGYYQLIRNKQLYKQVFVSYGFIGFVIIYFVFLVVDYNRTFVEWDEFMHWGPMIKEMFRLDKFYFVNESSLLTHKDYPPFISLFETMWCFFGTRYSEGLATQSLHVLIFSSSLLPLLDVIFTSNKSIKFKLVYTVVTFLVGFGLVMAFDTDGQGAGLSSLYTDLPLALIYSYVLILIFFSGDLKENIRFAYMLIAILFLSLSKQIAIALVLLGCLAYFFKGIIDKRKISKVAIETIVLLIVALVGIIVWKLLISSYQLHGQFDVGEIGIKGIYNVFAGNLTEIQRQTKDLYFSKLFFGLITTGIIKFSYLCFSFLSIALVVAIRIFAKDKMTNQSLILWCLYIVIGSICYASVLYVLYMFSFSQEEMLRLACWERYFNTYIMSLFFFDLFLSIYYFKDNLFKKKSILVLIVFFALFVNFERYNKLLPQTLLPEKEQELREKAEKIIPLTNEDDVIMLLDSYSWYDQYVINYYINGRHLDTSFVDTDLLFHDVNDTKFWNNFVNKIKTLDYVYFATYDLDSLNQALSEYTANKEYYEGVLYKVSVDSNNQLELIYVE